MRVINSSLFKRSIFSATLAINRTLMTFVVKLRLRKQKDLYDRTNSEPSTVLRPYSTSDCLVLFSALSLIMGDNARVDSARSKNSKSRVQAISPTFTGGKYLWREKVHLLREIYPAPDLWRGAIDSYKARCRPTELFDRSHLDFDLLKLIAHEHDLGRSEAFDSEIIVLTDLGYILNRSIVQEARALGKRVLVANPLGILEEVNLQDKFAVTDAFSGLSTSDMGTIIADRIGPEDSRLLLENRLRGRSIDWNVRPQFDFESDDVGQDEEVPLTTVFLHATRDAANYDPTECSTMCEDSLTWSMEAIRRLQNEGVSFKVRRHPSAPNYRDESWIFEKVLEQTKVSHSSLCSRAPMGAILKSGSVTTLAGTVTLEAVAQGKVAFNFGTLFPPDVGQQVELADFPRAVKNSSARTPKTESIEWARCALTLLELPRLRHARVERPMVPGLKGREFLLRDLSSGWELTWKLISKDGGEALLEAVRATLG